MSIGWLLEHIWFDLIHIYIYFLCLFIISYFFRSTFSFLFFSFLCRYFSDYGLLSFVLVNLYMVLYNLFLFVCLFVVTCLRTSVNYRDVFWFTDIIC